MGTEFNLISRDAQTALTEFSSDMTGAFLATGVEQWAKELGRYKASTALKTTWPIPVSAAGYHEFKGDMKYRSLMEKSVSLVPKTWQDGVAELASVVEAPDFLGWDAEPAAIAAEGMRLLNSIIAGQLEANPTLELDSLAMFHDAHPFNIFKSGLGTFDNNITGAGTDPTIANLKLAKARFRAIKAANGKPAGYRMTHVLVPAAQEEIWRDLLELDMLLTAFDNGTDPATAAVMPNRHKGSVKLIVADELTNDLQWYPLALNKPGAYPWVTQDTGAPEEIRSDKTSALYERTLKIGVAYIIRGNGALVLPHPVQRWAGTAP